MTRVEPTTGIPKLDRLIGEILLGDNVVWEVDSGAPVNLFVSRFVSACESAGMPVVYVSFNRSPQAIVEAYGGLMTPGRFTLVDCFSSGKGNRDPVFHCFFENPPCPALHVDDPSDPDRLRSVLMDLSVQDSAGYVIDSLTGMMDLWGDEEKAIRFFGYYCPRLFDLNIVAYWLLEIGAHSGPFLAKVRHITQVILEVSVSRGGNKLTVRKAANRAGAEIGVPQQFLPEGDGLRFVSEPRTARAFGLDTRMGEREEIIAHNEKLLGELRSRYRLDNVVGDSPAMRTALGTAAMAARSRASVLVTGETGTGKELAANIVHYNSPRGDGPFVKVNCGALPDTLLESELFGHVKGAFTGALRDRKGRFELADGGTLFLDEVGEMSPHLQVKLLRVLQERQFEPLGSARTAQVDVRVVAATSKDLQEEIRHGRFRHDIYYRLSVIPIHLPPLRERREDIVLLIDHFLEKYNREYDKRIAPFPRDVMDLLVSYPWPGNVRELESCIERVVVMSPGEALLPSLLPEEITGYRRKAARDAPKRPAADELETVRLATGRYSGGARDLAAARAALMRAVDETIIRAALDSGSSRSDLARRLGISRMTLRKRLRAYGIE